MTPTLKTALFCSLTVLGAGALSGCGSSTASTDKMGMSDRMGEAKMGSSMMQTEKMGGDKMQMEKRGTDKMAGDKMGMEAPMNNGGAPTMMEKPMADKSMSDKPMTGKMEQPMTDKPMMDK